MYFYLLPQADIFIYGFHLTLSPEGTGAYTCVRGPCIDILEDEPRPCDNLPLSTASKLGTAVALFCTSI